MQKKPSSISQLDALALSEIRGASVRSPPPLFSGSDPIWSLSLSLFGSRGGRVRFFSSQVSEINFPFLGWTENGKARRGKINPTSLSLSPHPKRGKDAPFLDFPPRKIHTDLIQCFCVVQQRVWEPFNYFPLLFFAHTGKTTWGCYCRYYTWYTCRCECQVSRCVRGPGMQ